jgi:hypothetical protein
MQVMTPICNSEHRPTANVLLGCFIDITLPRPTDFTQSDHLTLES